MEDYITDWDKLTEMQKQLAIANYAAIREEEEQKPCNMGRAREMAPLCRGWWVDIRYGYVTCNI